MAASLRARHTFATTLQPRSEDDAAKGLGVFVNADMASCYLSHLSWCDKEFHKNLSLRSVRVGSLLEAHRRQDLPERMAQLAEGLRFSGNDMQRLTLLAWTAGDEELGLMCTLSYALLLRLQSEMLLLQAGSLQELTTAWPPDRHSSFRVREGKLHVRLAQEAQALKQSLDENCVCSQVLHTRLRPVHFANWEAMSSGDKMISLPPSAAQHTFRRLRKLCGIPGAAMRR